MPAYNCQEYISKCIESVLNQSYKSFELIIINDGSIDNTEKVIDEYRQSDSRIIYHHQNNQGPSAARNVGILMSRGEYITFIDSDDTVNEKYVELLLSNMNKTNADITCSGYVDISKFGTFYHNDFIDENIMTTNEFLKMVCRGTGGVLWSKLFRNSLIKEHSLLLDEEIFMCEDLIFVMEYAEKCTSFSIVDKNLYHYNRLNEKSISANISPSYLGNYIKVWEKMKGILASNIKEKNEVEDIIREKVQAVAIKIIEQQCSDITKANIKVLVTNINMLLKNKYLSNYKSNFKSTNKLYSPMIFFIKNNLTFLCICYGVNLTVLKKINNLKLSIRKIVNV